ncbi:MAG: hypothetical protein E7270_07625 [Lachnospiraceae bacterium]|nr:hypothetical protein [Lachnospiraceae bacterium]
MYQRLKKILALILSVALFVNATDFSAFIIYGDERDKSEETTIELQTIEITTEPQAETTTEPETETTTEPQTETVTEPQTETKVEAEMKPVDTDFVDIKPNGAKTTVSATNALNYTSYDNINIGVYTHQDWTSLVAITHKSSLEGVDIILSNDNSKTSDKQTWDLTLNDLKYSDGTNIYYGLGSKEYPFAGNLTSQFTLTLKPKVSLFNYLSSKANIGSNGYAITINYVKGSNNIMGGLAGHLVLESDYEFDYKRLAITGYVGHQNGVSEVAGGLFGYVESKEGVTGVKFLIDDDMTGISGITNVYGRIAGGIAGVVDKNVVVEMSGAPILPNIVHSSATCAGGIIGKLSEGSKLITTATQSKPIVLKNGENGSTAIKITGAGYSGGVVGWVENSTIELQYVEKHDSVNGTLNVGGLIGYAESTSTDKPVKVTVSDCVIAAFHVSQTSNNISQSNCSGGIIGKYKTTDEDTESSLEISKVTTKTASRENSNEVQSFLRVEVYPYTKKDLYYYNGGIVGGICGNNVNIHDIDFKRDGFRVNQIYCFNTQYVWDTQSAGTVAGGIAGKNIEISNILLANGKFAGTDAYGTAGLSGKTVGGLVGRIGYFDGNNITGTKIKVSDIDIDSLYIWEADADQTKYLMNNGGLFGDIGKGSVVAICGDIDLSGVTTIAPDVEGYRDLCGKVEGRGFVAGSVNESLVYFEKDAVIKRPITVDDGVVYFSEDKDEDFSTNNPAYRLYTINDVGNYGSIYQNIDDENGNAVIQYDNEYGNEVTGTVGTETVDDKEFYVLDSLADALRLAITGHTFDESGDKKPRFARDCFGDKTINELLNANYLIKTDIDLGDAGINGFVRNDSLLYPFSGIMKGASKGENGKYKITVNNITRQYYGGLFPQLDDGVSFENIKIDGYLGYQITPTTATGAAGVLAANSKGGMTLKGVDVSTVICGHCVANVWDNSTMYCYGGYVGNVDIGTGEIVVDDCNISPNIHSMNCHYFVGGLFGKIILKNTSLSSSIKIINSTISTKIIADKNIGNGNTTSGAHIRSGGLIGFVGYQYKNVGETNNNNITPGAVAAMSHATMVIENIDIDSAVMDMTLSLQNNVKMSGGLLGYAWCNVDLKLNDVNVINESKLYSRGITGGLISFLSGSAKVTNINLESFEMKNTWGTNVTYSGLLFGNGQYAYITLDDATYVINPDAVTTENYSYFDEIVGLNLMVNKCNEFGAALDGSYSNAGVLNIIKSDFDSFKGDTEYSSYVNKVVEGTNKYSRYYYNLFTGDKNEWIIQMSGNSGNIDSPKKFMTFHISQYAHSYLKRYFNEYFSNSVSTSLTIANISIDLDMNGYSLYPTVLNGRTVNGNSHTITLYGEEISNIEKTLKDNEKSLVYRNNEFISNATTQHYLMHASLFYNVTGSTISDIKIKGTIAKNERYTGALIGGAVYGTTTIKNIILDNVTISNYNNESHGLMIARIGLVNDANNNQKLESANIVIDGIDTIYDTSDKTVAGALIGSVGNTNAKDARVRFENMRVSGVKSDKIFTYASFIYDYQYTSDLENNNCYGLYTFEYDDAVSGNVTYGKEIAKGVEYNDCLVSSIPEGDPNPLEEAINRAQTEANFYLPYVYKTKDIYVNPQNGNILEGCGTYEDPYVIKNSRQFLSLYCYLTGKTSYYNMFESKGEGTPGWTINRIGGDGDPYECSEKADSSVAHSSAEFSIVDGKLNEEFPTIDELRTAYYIIENDINLEDIMDLNDSILVQEYNGLGTLQYPFAGVISGKEIDTDKYSTITLPRQGESNSVQTNYGLIQYMKGAVVKDLNIITPVKDEGDTSEIFINVNAYAGGVAAILLGGDNIIDNVSTRVRFRAYNNVNYDVSTVIMGGYVGKIKNGSLILRNLNDKNVTDGCEYIHLKTGGNVTTVCNESDYVGMLVGKVEDGFILYEHNSNEKAFEDTTKKVLTKNDLVVSTANNNLKLANGFDIINGYALDKGIEAFGKINVTKDANGNLNVNMNSAEALEIIALALNSDALSIYYDRFATRQNSHDIYGYEVTAKCRKGTYADLGNKSSADREAVVLYDDGKNPDESNVFLYPYLLHKYVSFNSAASESDNYANYIDYTFEIKQTTAVVDNVNVSYNIYISRFNKIHDDVREYTTTYELDNGITEVLDLSGYGISFRGFGALYTVGRSDFRANFDGNSKNIKLSMNREFDSSKDFPVGMFNSLTYDVRVGDAVIGNNNATIPMPDEEALVIKEINIVDSTFDNISGTGTYTGAIAGRLTGKWDFEDIYIKSENTDTSIEGNLYVGGLIGSIDNIKWQNTYNDDLHDASNVINFRRCGTFGKVADTVKISGENTILGIGGIVGAIGRKDATNKENNVFYSGIISMEDCSINNTEISTGNTGNAGGFAGMLGFRKTDSTYSAVGVVNVSNTEGFAANNIENVIIRNKVDNDSQSESSIGGLFGKVLFVNKPAPNNDPMFGYIGINGCNVSNLNIIWAENNTSLTYNENGNNAIGGLIGFNRTQNTDIYNIKVNNSTIGTSENTACSAGGLIGLYRDTTGGGLNYAINYNVDNVEISNTNIVSKSGRVGGLVGHLRSDVNSINNCKIDNCTITSELESVGGLLGYHYPAYAGSTTINDIEVLASAIHTTDAHTNGSNAIAAGGIIGQVANYGNVITVGRVYVGNGCYIRGAKGGGGIFGIVNNNVNITYNEWIGVGAKYSSDAWVEDSVYNNIVGRIAGGIAGSEDSTTGRNISAKLCVAKNRIYSYDRMGNANGRCGSGGLAGYRNGASGQVILDDVTIMHNVIITSGRGVTAAEAYGSGNNNYMPAAGGMYGRIEANSSSTTECANITLLDNSIGFYDVSSMDEDEKYKGFKNLDINSEEVKLFYYDENNTLQTAKWSESLINEKNVGRYSIGIGTFIGYYLANNTSNNRQFNILRPKVIFSEDIGSIPAIDCGNIKYTTDSTQYGAQYPYSYRNTVHILYMKDKENTIIDSAIVTKTGEDNNLFENLDNIISDYRDVRDMTVDESDSNAVKNATYSFINSDKLKAFMRTGNGEVYDIIDGELNYYDSTYNAADYNGVPVIVLDGHEVQHLGDWPVFMLTGGNGVTKSTMARMKNCGFLNITCENAVITPQGKIILNNGNYGTGDNKNNTSISSGGYVLSLQNRPYDERIEKDDGVYYTITLLEYNYSVKTTTGTVKETVYVPVYVKEKVTVSSSVRILGGEDYSYTSAMNDGKHGEIVIAHGSVYTIFAEFVYDSIRLKDSFANIILKKTLIFKNSQESIPVGTKLTLVDNQTGKDYYYIVEDDNINEIPLTAFKNNGVGYEEKEIGGQGITYTANNYQMFDGTVIKGQVGIDRFYIYVQPSEGDHNITYDFQIKAEPVDKNNAAMDGYFTKKFDANISMEFIPGPEISFAGVSKDELTGIYTGTEGITFTEGTISNEKSITIDATVDISLADSTSPYWTKRESTIDSTNNGKYLDVAVTLVDKDGKEVAFPEGTNIIFNDGAPQTVNGSVIYLYKDSGKKFAYDTLERDINGNKPWYYYDVDGDDTYKWITSNDGVNYFYYEDQTEPVSVYNVTIDKINMLSNHIKLTFDFSLADVDEYAGNDYDVVLKLYRSTDPDYPIEEFIESKSNRQTEYKEEVDGEANKQMGAAVSVADDMSLGINLYKNFVTEEFVSFTNKLDFTNVINKRNDIRAQEDIEECAGDTYMVTYRIQKKNSRGNYVTIDIEDSPFKLSKISKDDNGDEVVTDMDITEMNGDQVYVEFKNFTEEDIKTGTDGVMYVTAWDMKLTANVEKLKENVDILSNYKISISYLPYNESEEGIPTDDAAAILLDYFIFTVANLKTDM